MWIIKNGGMPFDHLFYVLGIYLVGRYHSYTNIFLKCLISLSELQIKYCHYFILDICFRMPIFMYLWVIENVFTILDFNFVIRHRDSTYVGLVKLTIQ